MPVTDTAGVGPVYEFDPWSQERCLERLATFDDALDDTQRQLARAALPAGFATTGTLADALRTLQDTAAHATGATRSALDEQIQVATRCSRDCSCMADAWDGVEQDIAWRFLIDLDRLDDPAIYTWVVRRESDSVCLDSAPDVTKLWKAIGNDRYGWRSVRMQYTTATRTLHVTFKSDAGTYNADVVYTTAEQDATWTRITSLAGYPEEAEVADLIVRFEVDVLTMACDLWESTAGELAPLRLEHDHDLSAGVRAVERALHDVTPDVRLAATTLARTWTGSLAELIASATALAAA